MRSVKVSVGDRAIHVVRRGNGPKVLHCNNLLLSSSYLLSVLHRQCFTTNLSVSQAVLLMPGALGTAVTDLMPQVTTPL